MTTQPKSLNKAEIWIADHAVPIFLAIAVAIIIGAAAVFFTWQQQGDTENEVHVIAPQVTRINKAICDKGSLRSDSRARACAERIRIGLVNCRRVQRCRAAYLALATYPPPAAATAPSSTTATPDQEGGAIQQPSSHGHQQPGPSGGQQEGGQETAPTPSPGPSGDEGGSEAGGGQESPGNGAQGGSTSGAGVEVCVLERTCVGVEAGL